MTRRSLARIRSRIRRLLLAGALVAALALPGASVQAHSYYDIYDSWCTFYGTRYNLMVRKAHTYYTVHHYWVMSDYYVARSMYTCWSW